MLDIPAAIFCNPEGLGYGARRMGCPNCHKYSIGCAVFMSTVFNE